MRKKMTAQEIFEQVSRNYEELEDKENWASIASNDHWRAGAMFAYSFVLQLLYQLEEVEHEGKKA